MTQDEIARRLRLIRAGADHREYKDLSFHSPLYTHPYALADQQERDFEWMLQELERREGVRVTV